MSDKVENKKSRMNNRRYKLSTIRAELEKIAKQSEDQALFKRQLVSSEDPFADIYKFGRVLRPIYSFDRLYKIYNESDVLQSCVEAMQQNVDGFGYLLDYEGEDSERKNAGPKAEEGRLRELFNSVNETQSFMTIRKLMREDLEVLGNGGFEVIRDRRGKIALMYYLPFRNMRMTMQDEKYTTTTAYLLRNGRLTGVRIKKKFRRFVQLNKFDQSVRWFKELGDKRIMDATTGEYKSKASECKIVASEFWHFKLPFGGQTYGIPRWIGVSLDVMGRRLASFVNYDLFQSQGIPPMMLMISGGILTDDSLDEFETMIRSMRGHQQWNRIALLEANPESMGIDEKSNVKMDLKNLTDFRKEDLMFSKYLKETADNIRHRYRLPPLYTGAAETFTHATAKSARSIAEEQVFVPERQYFDEVVNTKLIRSEFRMTDWGYRTKGPKISNPDEVSKGVETFAKTGAFSVNNAIERANESFGLQMSKYAESWADLPITIVLKMLELGMLNITLSDGSTVTLPADAGRQGGHAEGLPNTGEPPQLPPGVQKVMNSDVFTEEEKNMYRKLMTIRAAVESVSVPQNGPEDL